MKILVLSYGVLDFDGRLRELIKVARLLGETVAVCRVHNRDACLDFPEVVPFNAGAKLAYLEFIKFSRRLAKQAGDFDIILSDNRKGLIAGLRSIKCRHDGKRSFWLQDARELYSVQSVSKLSSKAACLIEKYCYPKGDLLIVANSFRSEIMQKWYSLKRPPLVYENVRRLNCSADYVAPTHLEKLFDKNTTPKTYRIISTAGCEVSRKTPELIDAVLKRSDCQLFLIGGGSPSDIATIEGLAGAELNKRIFVIGKIGESDLAYCLKHADIGVVAYGQHDLNNTFCASGKIYEYLFEAVPVLCSSNPPLKLVCDTYNCGIASDNWDEALEQLILHHANYATNAKEFASLHNEDTNNAQLAQSIMCVLSAPASSGDYLA